MTGLILMVLGATLFALASVMEAYVKRYHPDVWEELNRWED